MTFKRGRGGLTSSDWPLRQTRKERARRARESVSGSDQPVTARALRARECFYEEGPPRRPDALDHGKSLAAVRKSGGL